MKTLLYLVSVLFVFAVANFVFANEYSSTPENASGYGIPGGVVYSDGKDAIYHDFRTGAEINLTSHIKGAVVTYPLRVSKSGNTLVWFQNQRLWSVDLPKGTPRPFELEIWGTIAEKRTYSDRAAVDYQDLIWQKPIQNIVISPNESKIMFESQYTGPAWKFWQATGEAISLVDLKNPRRNTPQNVLPLYMQQQADCIGIFSLSKNHNQCDPPTKNPFAPRYGNVMELPPVSTYRHVNGEVAPGHSFTAKGDTGDLEGRVYPRKGLAKNARFPIFLDNGLMAFIYQLENGKWGPIEIRVIDSPIFGGVGDEDCPDTMPGIAYSDPSSIATKFQKARRWEIQIPELANCEGIAGKPEKNSDVGSITIQSQGKLGCISYRDIERVINQSGVRQVPAARDGSGNEFFIESTKNVIQTRVNLIRTDVKGSCLTWVSDEAFLILGQDMCVYYCSKEATKKIFGPIKSPFCYCSKSPLQSSNTATNGKGEFVLKRSKDYDALLENKVGGLRLGYISTNPVTYSHIADERGKEVPHGGPVPFNVGKIGCQPPLEFCVTDETDFSKVRGKLSEYKFVYNYAINVKNGKVVRGSDDYTTNQTKTYPDRILLFKLDGRIAGIKVRKLENTEASYSYEWQILLDQSDSVNMQETPGYLAKKQPTETTKAVTVRKPIIDDQDKGIPSMKAGFLRPFTSLGLKLKWVQGQNGEIILGLNYRDSNTDVAQFFVVTDKAISEIDDPSSYNYRGTMRYVDARHMVNQTKTFQLGETIIVKYRDAYVALRPISIDKQIVTFKKKLLE